MKTVLLFSCVLLLRMVVGRTYNRSCARTICLLCCFWFSSKTHAQEILQKNQEQVVFRPFEFAYQSNDGEGTTQHRKEIADEKGSVKGSYGFTDPYGMYRAVDYVADNNGFRAVIKSNEPSASNQNPADAVWLVQPPPDTIPPPSGAQLLLEEPHLPAQTSSANYTPDVSPSAISNTLFSSLKLTPRGLHYPYPELIPTQDVIWTVPEEDSYSQGSTLKFLTKRSEFTPRA